MIFVWAHIGNTKGLLIKIKSVIISLVEIYSKRYLLVLVRNYL